MIASPDGASGRPGPSARLAPMVSQASRLNRLPAAERGITIGDFLVPVTIGERISTRVRHVALIVAGALLIALSANVSIPVPGSPVPITGQTFSVLLVGGALGARRGVLATLLYLVLGLFLPVYAEHKQGIGDHRHGQRRPPRPRRDRRLPHRLRPRQRLVGRLAELGWDRRFVGALAAMAVGNLVIYAIGVPWLMAATGMDFQTAFAPGSTPFLLGDVDQARPGRRRCSRSPGGSSAGAPRSARPDRAAADRLAIRLDAAGAADLRPVRSRRAPSARPDRPSRRDRGPRRPARAGGRPPRPSRPGRR